MRMLYLVGEPGAGKSSLMRALTSTLREAPMAQPVPHRALHLPGKAPHAAEIGVRRESFSGTDALAMSIQPKVVEWVRAEPYPLLVAEGDRLGNGKFFAAMQAMGVELHVVHVWVPPETLAARRAGRGDRQDAKWVQGRATKVANLVASHSAFPLQATHAPMVLAELLLALPGPIGAIARELRNGPVAGRPPLLVVPEQGGDGAPAGLPDDDQRGAADADRGTPQANGEPTEGAAGTAPDDTGGSE